MKCICISIPMYHHPRLVLRDLLRPASAARALAVLAHGLDDIVDAQEQARGLDGRFECLDLRDIGYEMEALCQDGLHTLTLALSYRP